MKKEEEEEKAGCFELRSKKHLPLLMQYRLVDLVVLGRSWP